MRLTRPTFVLASALAAACSEGGPPNAGDFGINGGSYGLRVKPEFVTLLTSGNPTTKVDKRSGILYSKDQSLSIASLTDFSQGYLAPKYRSVTSTGAPGSDQNFSDIDYPVFRLARAVHRGYAALGVQGRCAGGHGGDARPLPAPRLGAGCEPEPQAEPGLLGRTR